jgi:hypothetical protein
MHNFDHDRGALAAAVRERGILLSKFRKRFERFDGGLLWQWHALQFGVAADEDAGAGFFGFLCPVGWPFCVRGATHPTEDEAIADLFDEAAERSPEFVDTMRRGST